MTPPETPEPKAQHYIPRFYLKGFTDKQGKLWVCEKFKPIRKSKPKDEAHRPDYYTHAEQGERDETAEDTLEEIESRAAPIIRKLANPAFRPTPQQMGHVYLFVAFTFARVPSWRENLDRIVARFAKDRQVNLAKDRAGFHRMCADMERDTGKPLGMDIEDLRQYILKGEYEVVQASRAFNLGSMFESAIDIAKHLNEFSYEVLYAPAERVFVTSDSPVFTLLPEGGRQATIGMGFGWPRVQVHFRLNKRACLRLKKGIESARLQISEQQLEQINRITMLNATQHLYSSENYRKTSRLFDQYGCKIKPGTNAFMPNPEPPKTTSNAKKSRD